MLQPIRRRVQSLQVALTRMPDRQTWYRCGVLFGASSVVALAAGFWSRLIRVEPIAEPCSTTLALPGILFIFPGIAEELLFRGLLLPHPDEAVSATHRGAAAVGGVAAFILWHPLQAMVLPPARRTLFRDGRFLAQAGLLGSTCTGAYYLSGSIWPPVVMHWLTVTAWILYLGGRRQLR